MEHAEWKRTVEEALESGFDRLKPSQKGSAEFVLLADGDKGNAISAVMADDDEALEHFGNMTYSYSQTREGEWVAKREADVRELVRLLEAATIARARNERDADVFCLLGYHIAKLMLEEVSDTLDEKLRDMALDYLYPESAEQLDAIERRAHFAEILPTMGGAA